MSLPPLRRHAVVREAERIDLEETGQYRYRTMRGIAQMAPAAERM
jgi:hypothetical protein